MRKEGLVNIPLTGHITSKRSRGEQRVIYLTDLCESTVELIYKKIVKMQRLFRAQGVGESRDYQRPEGTNESHRRIFKVG